MLDALGEALKTQLSNQVVAGAIALGLVGVVAAALRKLPGALWSQLQRAFIVTVTLDSRNEIYGAFLGWVDDQRLARRSRWFTAVRAPPPVATEATAADASPLQYSPAAGWHFFWHAGRLMWLHREIAMNLQVVETVRLSALFGSRAGMEALLEEVQRHASAQRHNRLALHTIDRWGENWQLSDTKPRRPLASVVLDEGAAHRLLDDIHEFFARRAWYETMGIPWRRGYLLHGPPGTGKTSIAYALAGELKLNLCALSLTNPKLNDHTLADLLQRTPARSLILIEDIDAFFNERRKQDARVEVSFSGLLNALDGVGAQEGRIVVLTTNHRDRLDAALIRPGRIDMEVELGHASKAQLRTLYLRFHPEAQVLADALAGDYPAGSLSPARIQQALLQGDTPEKAADRLRRAWSIRPQPI
jgi:mitochondrial chaperone BCS1